MVSAYQAPRGIFGNTVIFHALLEAAVMVAATRIVVSGLRHFRKMR